MRAEETPHPSGDGWRKRRRRTPSPQGRGLYFRLGHPRCPAKDVGHAQPRGRGQRPNSVRFSSGKEQKTEVGPLCPARDVGHAQLPQGGEERVDSISTALAPWGRGWSRPALREDRVRGLFSNQCNGYFVTTPKWSDLIPQQVLCASWTRIGYIDLQWI